MTTALLVEDDADALNVLDRFVRSRKIETRTARNLADARRHLREAHPDIAIVDIKLPDGDGIDLAAEVADRTRVVVVTGHRSPELVVRALRSGVHDFLLKPLDLARLEVLLDSCSADREGADTILGESEPIRRLLDEIELAAQSQETALIMGETGVGKELVARALHTRGPRAKQPFVAVNCGALPESLVESALFGHERGSFTGAHKKHEGVFEQADSGTLFLDEVTELPLSMQVRLLRVLERGTVTRVGGEEELSVDVRIVAASNRNPVQAVADGKLREDLLYRLHVLALEVPPLRSRGKDIELLAKEFVNRLNRERGTRKQLGPDALGAILSHNWPGNVRELQNVVRRAHLFSKDTIERDCVRFLNRDTPSEEKYSIGVGLSLEEAEKRLLLGTLERFDGDKRLTAEALGVSLKTIYNRLNRYAADS